MFRLILAKTMSNSPNSLIFSAPPKATLGFTNLAMFSGVAEMIARILVSLYAVPVFGFIAVCYGDPMAWIAADLFLVPAFIYVYRRLKKQVFTNSQVTQTVA